MFFLFVSILFLPLILAIIQRVLPMKRAFTYLIPFFCMIIASGFVYFLDIIKDIYIQKNQRKKFKRFLIIIFIFILLLSGYLKYFNKNELNEESWKNIEEVGNFLNDNVLLDEQIMCLNNYWPEKQLMNYVIYKNNLTNLKFNKRLDMYISPDEYYAYYIITTKYHNLSDAIARENIPLDKISDPTIIFETGNTKVYYAKNLFLNKSDRENVLKYLYTRKYGKNKQ